VGEIFQNIDKQPFPVFHHSLLVAGRAKVSPLARKGQQILMATFRTFNSCESTMQVPAIQITVNNIHDMGAPESKMKGIPLVPSLIQFFKMILNALVVATGLWATRAINVEGCEAGYRLSHKNYQQEHPYRSFQL
jgi:hypothetical protein